MAEMLEPRLADLKGQVVLVRDTVRIARIEGKTTIERTNKTKEIETVPGVLVTVTIPTVPIAGLVTDEQASSNRVIARVVHNDRHSDTHWMELWAERTVPQVEILPKQPARILEGKFRKQLYCYSQQGRSPRHERSSPVANLPVRYDELDAKDVPADLFDSDKAVRHYEEVEAV